MKTQLQTTSTTPAKPRRRRRLIVLRRIAVLSAICMCASFIFGGKQASALVPTDIPAAFWNYIACYDSTSGNPNKYQVTHWISPAGQPANNTVVEVPYGTTTVPLWLNDLDFLYHEIVNGMPPAPCAPWLPADGTPSSAAALTSTLTRINSITVTPSGGINGFVPGQVSAIFSNPGSRYWFGGPTGFNYVSSSPITSSITITVFVNTQSVNTFNSASSFCVSNSNPPPAVANAFDFNPCPSTTAAFSLTIRVADNPPAIGVFTDCANDRIILQANDADGGTLSINYSIDGGPYVSAGPPQPSLPNATYYIDMSSYNQAVSHPISAYTAGYYPYGVPPLSSVRFENSKAYGPCPFDFELEPFNTVTLDAPDDAPGGATIRTGIDVVTMGGPQVNGITVNRSYYKISGGVQTAIPLPTAPADGATVTVPNTGIHYFGGAGGDHITFGVLNPGDQVCADITIGPAEGTASRVSFNVVTVATPSKRLGPVCARVFGKPYLSVYRNDIFAGGGIGAVGCTVNSTARITTFLNAPAQGAGTQFAAYAMGSINSFASAKLRSGLLNNPPKDGLSFANNTGTPGGFGSAVCNTNYPFTPSGGVLPASPNLAPLANGIYQRTGDLTIDTGSSNINPGSKLTIYVDGDLIIKQNIQYVGSAGWTNASQIPSLAFIVRGNIYIDKAVNVLDGVYIAQKTLANTKGTIYTCSNGNVPYTNATIQSPTFYTDCDDQLVVHGNLVGQDIKWLRTYSTVGRGTTSEDPYGVAPRAAELIISGPETYISLPTTGQPGAIESITSLPPIL